MLQLRSVYGQWKIFKKSTCEYYNLNKSTINRCESQNNLILMHEEKISVFSSLKKKIELGAHIIQMKFHCHRNIELKLKEITKEEEGLQSFFIIFD